MEQTRHQYWMYTSDGTDTTSRTEQGISGTSTGCISRMEQTRPAEEKQSRRQPRGPSDTDGKLQRKAIEKDKWIPATGQYTEMRAKRWDVGKTDPEGGARKRSQQTRNSY